ncbi:MULTISPECIES: hypothetical protein [unclassified Streptomyces]|uniref:hypothetical protein n=1 Tax=unclassified Streptomyces TaxID=2593676 RepID=UPI00202540F6|nr:MULTISPECIES: hypothetical protein [unclassified Streptomyces]MCX4550639.1 hypothetical protein [Streptomyces sp. NBC_01500]WSC22083.1 hypothetical protein OIE60_21645 [Streptomyces sp. NBC_01766]
MTTKSADLPDFESLTTCQQRGGRCVFCGAGLRSGFLRDLGERVREVYGSSVRWFPRSCLTCPTKGKL